MTGEAYKILLVDDDKFLLDIHSRKFVDSGHEVQTVMKSSNALEILREGNEFDAILLDLVMPSMDGIELLKKIREEELARDTAVIVFSNQDQSTDIEKAKKYNIAGYIVKASSVPSEVVRETVEIIEGFKSNN